MASWRLINCSRWRKGVCIQRLSIRLPIGVTHRSSTDAIKVLSQPPARFWVNSKLRRVAASRDNGILRTLHGNATNMRQRSALRIFNYIVISNLQRKVQVGHFQHQIQLNHGFQTVN